MPLRSHATLILGARLALATAPLLHAATAPALPAPTTPNPGLRYYYPLPADPAAKPQTLRVDICVYGGTPGGVGAAVQARRLGKTSALAVFRRHVGGLTAAGLTAVDLGKKESIGGMAAEFLDRMGQWSGFRAADAERTMRAMLAEAGVPVWFEHRLARVEKDGNRIRALVFENGNRIEAAVFIDATYEGDRFTSAARATPPTARPSTAPSSPTSTSSVSPSIPTARPVIPRAASSPASPPSRPAPRARATNWSRPTIFACGSRPPPPAARFPNPPATTAATTRCSTASSILRPPILSGIGPTAKAR
jgi:hypothetical protein